MIKTLASGYGPCALLAIAGYVGLGGSLVAWLGFVWIVGAMMTLAVAYFMHTPGPMMPIAKPANTLSYQPVRNRAIS